MSACYILLVILTLVSVLTQRGVTPVPALMASFWDQGTYVQVTYARLYVFLYKFAFNGTKYLSQNILYFVYIGFHSFELIFRDYIMAKPWLIKVL